MSAPVSLGIGVTATTPDAGSIPGLGTMATQNANAVAITGGAIANVALTSFTGPTDWTPTDGSGAGLTLTVNAAKYTKTGQIGILTFDVTYPVTADTSAAKLASVPAAMAAVSATLGQGGVGLVGVTSGVATVTTQITVVFNGATTLQLFWGAASGSTVQNAYLSGARIRGSVIVMTSS